MVTSYLVKRLVFHDTWAARSTDAQQKQILKIVARKQISYTTAVWKFEKQAADFVAKNSFESHLAYSKTQLPNLSVTN